MWAVKTDYRAGRGSEKLDYLGGCLCKHLILFQDTLQPLFGGNLEKSDAFDGGHGR